MQREPIRFINDFTCLEHFTVSVLLSCPKCKKCAELVPDPSGKSMRRGITRKAVCHHCGYSGTYESPTFDRACSTTDWHRRLPLWLQVPCCNEVLWALNADHLQLLECFIEAGLRERSKEQTISNHSMVSRLPKWMSAAKHRDEVLRALSRLKRLLPADTPLRRRA